jgi:hypothetical protein
VPPVIPAAPGRPVQFVNVPDDGVPRAPAIKQHIDASQPKSRPRRRAQSSCRSHDQARLSQRPVAVLVEAVRPAIGVQCDPLVFDPLSVATRATVPPVAAPVILKPAACDPVEASIANAGFVAPLSPTARAVADAEVIVCAALASVEENDPAAAVSVPVSVGPADNTMLPVPVTAFERVPNRQASALTFVSSVLVSVIAPVDFACRDRRRPVKSAG